jgi:response regulator RpfG family c-di-GMP phosphodiesterase
MNAIKGSPAGRVILIVEDEFLVGELMRGLLLRANAEVIGPIRDAGEAMAIARHHKMSGVLLDVELAENSTSAGVAEILCERRIPFIVISGLSLVKKSHWP